MGENNPQTATEEYEEFVREREAAVEAEGRGGAELTIDLEEKWFSRYPNMRSPRSLFKSCNRLEDYLLARSEESD